MSIDKMDGSIRGPKRDSTGEHKLQENGLEDEPDFSDPSDYMDEISEEDLMGDFLKKRPGEADGIDSVIVVDNIPVVGPERLEKLQNVIRKIFSKFGTIINEHYPLNESNTKGYIFLEYKNSDDALEAVKSTNGYKLDRNHTFIVNLFTDFDKYEGIKDEWEPPSPQPFKDLGNLRGWLQDPHAFDQYSLISEGGDKTSIMLNTPNEPLCVETRMRWTETYVQWSPRGTFLATFHQKGMALWGGESFQQIARFGHPGVQLIDFSPCERYMVTFSPIPDSRDDPQAIIIWEVMTGEKKRSFRCESSTQWPIFKWSFDGTYFARMSADTLSIYETPSFGLLEKKSIKVPMLRDFEWSPTENIIVYWTPEDQNVPARVTLIEIPSRKQLSMKNLVNVADCKIHWQKTGDYLCVKVDRYKSKKEDKDGIKYAGIFHNFNIFRIREKQIPVDIVEIKETIMAFAWEPIGHKFAFIHGEMPRISVSFYQVKKAGAIELIKTLEKRQCNHLFWSPTGQFCILAGLRSMNGVLEFVDTQDMTIMNSAEHFMATDVEWDPTGRYVSTGVSWWGHKVDNAYWFWNFQGRLLHKRPVDRFCQLLWRPRPPTYLSEQDLKDLKKNMKKYNSRFNVEDRMRESKASKEQIETRRRLKEEFMAWRAMVEEKYEEEKPLRMELRGGIDTDLIANDVDNFDEETIEFLLKVEETPYEE